MRRLKEKVVYYGQIGSFTETAALSVFGESKIELVPSPKFLENVFTSVVHGEAEFGVVPVENSDAGIVSQTYDLLSQEKVYVTGEIILRIEQCLLANVGAKIEEIRKVYSHPTALLQCSKFLRSRQWELLAEGDTATCAKKLGREKSPDSGVIAGERAAKVYELQVLATAIQNDPNNFTRFFVISNRQDDRRHNKVSIIVGTRGNLNSVYDYLGLFVKRGIVVERIESRPNRVRPFEYDLYIDFVGDLQDTRIRDLMTDLLRSCQFVRVIGSYDAASLPG